MVSGGVVVYVGDGVWRAAGADAGWQIEQVETVSAARSRLSDGGDDAWNPWRSDVDCVVSEADLPDGSGLEICRAIEPQQADLPFVLVPDTGGDELAREAVAAGVDRYVPATTLSDPAELWDCVAEVVETPPGGRFRKLVEESTDVVAVISPAGRIEYVSPSIEEVLGYAPADRIGENGLDAIHPADRESVRDAIETALAAPDETVSREYRIRDATGDWRWVESRARSYVDDPAIGGLVVSLRDVTERKAQADRYATLVDEANDGIVITQDQEIEFVNEQFAAMVGTARDTLVGQPVLSFVAPEDRDRVEESYRARVDGKRDTDRYEIEILTADDGRVTVEVSTSLVQYQGGTSDLAIVRDVTERRERQRELELYETMLNAVPDPVYAVDDAGEFIAVNETATDVTGWTDGQPLDEHVSVVMDDDDIEQGQRRIRQLLQDDDRDRGSYEMDLHTIDGDVIPTENHVALLTDGDGEFRGSVGVLRDITDRRRRKRRLAVLNRALRHDLRNSMHVILANTELVTQGVDEPTVVEKLQTIRSRAESITSLSEKAGEIEQTLRGGVQPRNPIDLGSVLAEQLARYRSLDDVTIETDIPEHAWVEATELVDVAVENLIENSIQHADQPTVGVTVSVEDDTVVVTVADDGPGIPEAERRIVTQGSETPLDHASGLGLWLVAWITRDSGGEVTFVDPSDGGSAVRLELPRAAPRDRDDRPSAGGSD